MGIVLCAATLASVGVFVLVMMVWVMGWGFLWYKAPELIERQIEPEQRLVHVPGGVLLKLKLVTVRQHLMGLSRQPDSLDTTKSKLN